MRVLGNPVQIPGQNAYRFTYVSTNNKMHAIVFISGNGKHLANVSILGRHGTGGLALLKGLTSKEDKLFRSSKPLILNFVSRTKFVRLLF